MSKGAWTLMSNGYGSSGLDRQTTLLGRDSVPGWAVQLVFLLPSSALPRMSATRTSQTNGRIVPRSIVRKHPTVKEVGVRQRSQRLADIFGPPKSIDFKQGVES